MLGKVSLCVNTMMGILSRVTNVFADSRKPPCWESHTDGSIDAMLSIDTTVNLKQLLHCIEWSFASFCLVLMLLCVVNRWYCLCVLLFYCRVCGVALLFLCNRVLKSPSLVNLVFLKDDQQSTMLDW
jgi:hypothetical protein